MTVGGKAVESAPPARPVLAVMGTSLPRTAADGTSYRGWGNEVGRLRNWAACSRALGSSSLGLHPETFAAFSAVNPVRVTDITSLSPAPDVILIAHAGNDVGTSVEDGSRAYTPADFQSDYTSLVNQYFAAFPSATVIGVGIETAYQSASRDAWDAAIPLALAASSRPSQTRYISTDAWYSLVSLKDGVHPDSAGATFIAEKIAPLIAPTRALLLTTAALGAGQAYVFGVP
jgi:hypothetical protein